MNTKVELTEKAANVFRQLIVEEGNTTKDTFLLMGARSGGCSGYMFTLDTTHDITENDYTFDLQGIKVVANKKTLDEIIGDVRIDFNDDNLVEQGFEFKRLKYNITCGCGESFTPIKELIDGPKKLGW